MFQTPQGKLIAGLIIIMLGLGVALEIVNLKTAYWNCRSS